MLFTNRPITLNPTGWIAGDFIDVPPGARRAIMVPEGGDRKVKVFGDGTWTTIPWDQQDIASEFSVQGNELVVQVPDAAYHVFRWTRYE